MTTAARFTTPANALGPATADIQAQVPRWRKYGTSAQYRNPDAGILPQLTPGWEGSTMAVWPGDKATGTQRTWASATPGGGAGAPCDEPARWETLGKGQFPLFRLPVGPGWKGAGGTTDAAYFVVYGDCDYWVTQGRRPSTWWDRLLISIRQFGKADQPNEWDWVADGANRVTPANAWNTEGSGMGKVPWLVGVVWADEVLNARGTHHGIGHVLRAVSMATETGPLAHFLEPATRVEHSAVMNGMLSMHPNAPHHTLTMPGLVLASTLTEAQIDALLLKLYPTDFEWRATVKVWWMTLSEHGVIIGATTGTGGTVVEVTTMADGYYEAPKWRKAGHTSPARNASVWTGYPWETLYAVNPSPDGVTISGPKPAANRPK